MDIIIDLCKTIVVIFLAVLCFAGGVTFLVGTFNLSEHDANQPETDQDED